jgi:hypothetical protein
MRNMKLAVIGAIVLLVGLLVIAAMRDPAGSDVKIVRGVKPFYSGTEDDARLIRYYSLQLPYDEAVKSVQKELSGPGWMSKVTYGETVFAHMRNLEFVQIHRGRTVLDLETADTGFGGRSPFKLAGPAPDPHGWVTIITVRKTAPTRAFLRGLQKEDNGPRLPYCLVIPEPKTGPRDQQVDVHKGTASLESDNLTEMFKIANI